ncbi:MAG: hypothetical protein K2X34_08580 [Hyphomonadaceae bacterium]|nr:hypothetical protein [Hyphomonadaceae bacterium]
MLPALLVLGAVFVLLFVVRIGGAQRTLFRARWPAVLLAGAALLLALRGAVWPAIAFAALAGLAWAYWPALARRLDRAPPTISPDSAADAEARSLLGVSLTANAADIRRAYRRKMAQAHPDRGGAHADAARLTAARDRLLKKLS